MPRPIKNNADYFPHDSDMRNDPKIKAIRRKFGIEGYGIYCMVIEYLADADHFKAKINELGIELMSGDFDIAPEKLTAIIDYAIVLDLLQKDTDSNISCNSLEKRLNPLLSKRERDRDRVIDSENTQSKVKESKENKSKEKQSEEPDSLSFFGIDKSVEMLLADDYWKHSIHHIAKGKDLGGAVRSSFAYLESQPQRFKLATLNDLKKTTLSWLENKKPVTPDLKALRVDQKERLKNL